MIYDINNNPFQEQIRCVTLQRQREEESTMKLNIGTPEQNIIPRSTNSRLIAALALATLRERVNLNEEIHAERSQQQYLDITAAMSVDKDEGDDHIGCDADNWSEVTLTNM